MKNVLAIVACVLLMGWTGSAYAVPIFYDNFDTENGGNGTSNYSSFSNWTINNGSVDLVGGGYWDGDHQTDLSYGDGLSVDLDGSTGTAGVMSSNTFNVVSGQTYDFSFLLAGNQRGGDADYLTVSVNISDYYEEFTVAPTEEWTTITRSVTIYGPHDTANIVFNHAGGDNVGALIDEVSFSASPVPEPATMLLFGTGLAGLSAIRRKKFKK